jgi:hypothetical protein
MYQYVLKQRETILKNSKVVFFFCHLKKLIRPETFGPTLVHRCGWFGGVAAYHTVSLYFNTY